MYDTPDLEGNEFIAQFIHCDYNVDLEKKAKKTKLCFVAENGADIEIMMYLIPSLAWKRKEFMQFWADMGVEFTDEEGKSFVNTGKFPKPEFYDRWFKLERIQQKNPKYYNWTCHGEVQAPESADIAEDSGADDIPDDDEMPFDA